MILADKIINLRKKNGWSQEELGEMIGVSRQSISKYEGAQAIPDMDKILKLSEVFGVSTDFLMKDSMEMDSQTEIVTTEVSNVRQISLEEARDYINLKSKLSVPIALATAMCIISPVILLFLVGISECTNNGLSSNLASGIGVVALLCIVAVAVGTFIATGSKTAAYEFIDTEEFETAYGVDSVLKEMKEQYKGAYTRDIIVGVVLCILSPVPLIISVLAEASDFVCILMTCALLIFIACAVILFIISGSRMSAIDRILQIGDYTRENKRQEKKMQPFSSAFWLIITAVYLGVSFFTNAWDVTWIIWPVAGVAFEAVMVILKAVVSNK